MLWKFSFDKPAHLNWDEQHLDWVWLEIRKQRLDEQLSLEDDIFLFWPEGFTCNTNGAGQERPPNWLIKWTACNNVGSTWRWWRAQFPKTSHSNLPTENHNTNIFLHASRKHLLSPHLKPLFLIREVGNVPTRDWIAICLPAVDSSVRCLAKGFWQPAQVFPSALLHSSSLCWSGLSWLQSAIWCNSA